MYSNICVYGNTRTPIISDVAYYLSINIILFDLFTDSTQN